MSTTMWRGSTWGLGEIFSKGTSDSEQLRVTQSNSEWLRATQSDSEQLRVTSATQSNSEQLRDVGQGWILGKGDIPCVPDLLQSELLWVESCLRSKFDIGPAGGGKVWVALQLRPKLPPLEKDKLQWMVGGSSVCPQSGSGWKIECTNKHHSVVHTWPVNLPQTQHQSYCHTLSNTCQICQCGKIGSGKVVFGVLTQSEEFELLTV